MVSDEWSVPTTEGLDASAIFMHVLNQQIIRVSGPAYKKDWSPKRRVYHARTSEGTLEFHGTPNEARDFFRDKFPSKSLIFKEN